MGYEFEPQYRVCFIWFRIGNIVHTTIESAKKAIIDHKDMGDVQYYDENGKPISPRKCLYSEFNS